MIVSLFVVKKALRQRAECDGIEPVYYTPLRGNGSRKLFRRSVTPILFL